MQNIRYWAVLSAVVAPTFFSISVVGEDLRLTLPPNTFAVAGQPLAIVYDNLVLTQTPESFRFRFSLERDGKPTRSLPDVRLELLPYRRQRDGRAEGSQSLERPELVGRLRVPGGSLHDDGRFQDQVSV